MDGRHSEAIGKNSKKKPIKVTKGGTSSPKQFLKKENSRYREVQRHVKKRNGVITLPWQLQCQKNINHSKFSSLYSAAVVTFFRYIIKLEPAVYSQIGKRWVRIFLFLCRNYQSHSLSHMGPGVIFWFIVTVSSLDNEKVLWGNCDFDIVLRPTHLHSGC